MCEVCQKREVKEASHSRKDMYNISEPLQLFYMDLVGPVNVMSMSSKHNALVMVDDHSKYTRGLFLHSKVEAPQMFFDHIKYPDHERS